MSDYFSSPDIHTYTELLELIQHVSFTFDIPLEVIERIEATAARTISFIQTFNFNWDDQASSQIDVGLLNFLKVIEECNVQGWVRWIEDSMRYERRISEMERELERCWEEIWELKGREEEEVDRSEDVAAGLQSNEEEQRLAVESIDELQRLIGQLETHISTIDDLSRLEKEALRDSRIRSLPSIYEGDDEGDSSGRPTGILRSDLGSIIQPATSSVPSTIVEVGSVTNTFHSSARVPYATGLGAKGDGSEYPPPLPSSTTDDGIGKGDTDEELLEEETVGWNKEERDRCDTLTPSSSHLTPSSAARPHGHTYNENDFPPYVYIQLPPGFTIPRHSSCSCSLTFRSSASVFHFPDSATRDQLFAIMRYRHTHDLPCPRLEPAENINVMRVRTREMERELKHAIITLAQEILTGKEKEESGDRLDAAFWDGRWPGEGHGATYIVSKPDIYFHGISSLSSSENDEAQEIVEGEVLDYKNEGNRHVCKDLTKYVGLRGGSGFIPRKSRDVMGAPAPTFVNQCGYSEDEDEDKNEDEDEGPNGICPACAFRMGYRDNLNPYTTPPEIDRDAPWYDFDERNLDMKNHERIRRSTFNKAAQSPTSLTGSGKVHTCNQGDSELDVTYDDIPQKTPQTDNDMPIPEARWAWMELAHNLQSENASLKQDLEQLHQMYNDAHDTIQQQDIQLANAYRDLDNQSKEVMKAKEKARLARDETETAEAEIEAMLEALVRVNEIFDETEERMVYELRALQDLEGWEDSTSWESSSIPNLRGGSQDQSRRRTSISGPTRVIVSHRTPEDEELATHNANSRALYFFPSVSVIVLPSQPLRCFQWPRNTSLAQIREILEYRHNNGLENDPFLARVRHILGEREEADTLIINARDDPQVLVAIPNVGNEPSRRSPLPRDDYEDEDACGHEDQSEGSCSMIRDYHGRLSNHRSYLSPPSSDEEGNYHSAGHLPNTLNGDISSSSDSSCSGSSLYDTHSSISPFGGMQNPYANPLPTISVRGGSGSGARWRRPSRMSTDFQIPLRSREDPGVSATPASISTTPLPPRMPLFNPWHIVRFPAGDGDELERSCNFNYEQPAHIRRYVASPLVPPNSPDEGASRPSLKPEISKYSEFAKIMQVDNEEALDDSDDMDVEDLRHSKGQGCENWSWPGHLDPQRTVCEFCHLPFQMEEKRGIYADVESPQHSEDARTPMTRSRRSSPKGREDEEGEDCEKETSTKRYCPFPTVEDVDEP